MRIFRLLFQSILSFSKRPGYVPVLFGALGMIRTCALAHDLGILTSQWVRPITVRLPIPPPRQFKRSLARCAWIEQAINDKQSFTTPVLRVLYFIAYSVWSFHLIYNQTHVHIHSWICQLYAKDHILNHIARLPFSLSSRQHKNHLHAYIVRTF